ncbi:MAG: membrane protein of unknown function [Candidatus Thorarchaeota archaeon]|nr:MAG: membrane protein of unknown function [Candidatus Thorarchaeota archaeon]
MADIIADITKILFVLGLLFIFMKAIGKRSSGSYGILYNVHKAGPSLATILAFIHGLLITPINPTYVWTGWLFGLNMILLMVLGIYMGFQSEWTPFDEEQNKKYKIFRIIKWILTITVIATLGMHYLLPST